MKISSINLNLLTVLHALLNEKSVSKAAAKVNLSQPQVSNILKEIRIIFEDDILSRGAKNQMKLTEKGKSLLIPVNDAIEKCREIFLLSDSFNPSKAAITFKIATNSHLSSLLIPDTLSKIKALAPNIRLRVININDIDKNNIVTMENFDIAIGNFSIDKAYISEKIILKSELICIASSNHPILLKKQIDNSEFAKYEFIHTEMGEKYWEDELKHIDSIFLGKRKIALTLPHIMAAFSILEKSSYLCITHKNLLTLYGEKFNLAAVPLPQKLKDAELKLYWKKVDEKNIENKWLRDILMETANTFKQF